MKIKIVSKEGPLQGKTITGEILTYHDCYDENIDLWCPGHGDVCEAFWAEHIPYTLTDKWYCSCEID